MAKYQRLKGEEWQDIRRIVLERDKYHCVRCGADIRAPGAAHIHHLVPLAAAGSNEPANLISLCPLCHAAQHPDQAMGWNLRQIFKSGCYRLARLCDQSNILPERGNFDSFLRIFGKHKFRAGQLPLILTALKGQSLLFVSPTGSGKSLCFQLPALMQAKASVVICPLKVLMTEQVSDLWRRQIPASFINSDLGPGERAQFYRLLQENAVKLTYMTPERFFTQNAAERQALRALRPAFLIIDEAHCVDRWGAAFRPEYGRLREVRAMLGNPPVLAFTATAGKEMQTRILHSLGCDNAKRFVRDVDRPNIALMRIEAAAADRARKIAEMLSLPALQGQKLMVFVPTVKIGKMLQEDLAEFGFNVPFYHAKAENSFARQEMVKRFKGESQPVINRIICTKAFGMGLDIADVRLVIHWQQSASVEDYLQEYGRAGRDGKQAAAVVFYSGDGESGGIRINKRHSDIGLLEYMAEGTVKNAIRQRAAEIIGKKGGISAHDAEILAEDEANIEQTEYGNIAALQAMIRADACFRRALSSYFKEDFAEAVKKRSLPTRLAMWIVERLYAEEQPVWQSGFCCDYCEKIKTGAPIDELYYLNMLLKAPEKGQ